MFYYFLRLTVSQNRNRQKMFRIKWYYILCNIISIDFIHYKQIELMFVSLLIKKIFLKKNGWMIQIINKKQKLWWRAFFAIFTRILPLNFISYIYEHDSFTQLLDLRRHVFLTFMPHENKFLQYIFGQRVKALWQRGVSNTKHKAAR